jgi:hypothetical protein
LLSIPTEVVVLNVIPVVFISLVSVRTNYVRSEVSSVDLAVGVRVVIPGVVEASRVGRVEVLVLEIIVLVVVLKPNELVSVVVVKPSVTFECSCNHVGLLGALGPFR